MKLTIEVNGQTLEVAPPDKEFVSTWHDATAELKKRLGEGWRLPTRVELYAMYEQLHKKGLGGFAAYTAAYWSSSEAFSYWSSSEDRYLTAWAQYFYGGRQLDFRKDTTRYVRPVREI